ncbi:hypothetical protein [Paenibacillus harenae]|uniref:hypothetical protein n=1 Tax=Paenibacillus harenae TaxID=306543 RepID=UPI002793F3C9|nr:hypothetical protein [Paenibacillus harenae]MDQ0062452.1 hypothetical protein [Paenibacillus harenae]
MKKRIQEELWNDFVSMVKESTTNYESYYSSLVSWVKKHRRYFTNDILAKSYLNILMSLEPKKYIVDDPEFKLDSELNWYIRIKPTNISINYLNALIESRLWDMVTIRSKKECPNCLHGGLRYLLLESKDEILLECSECAWTENADGTKYDGGIARMLPANKMDLQRHGIYNS